MPITHDILGQLKDKGYKLTTPRLEVLKSFTTSKPLSAQEVFYYLKNRGVSIDLVTIYRTLELLNDLGFVQKTQFEDKVTLYELAREEHHHHLVCTNCGNVEEVEVNEADFISQIEKKSKFKIKRHSLEFFGVCNKCQR